MNAINLLKDDHHRIRKLLAETEKKASPQQRRPLFDEIARELRMHEKLEEEILYPAMTAHPQGRGIALEGYEEHRLTAPLVRDLEELPPTDERWSAKLRVLSETLEHHIKEQHDALFPKAKRIFNDQELEQMGTRMEAMKGPDVRASS